ncbi:MAG: UvrD-helicase domain-containing protein [Oscillospiraceae bacterium]|nr:MAG: UvrD-helicase domain-containing protein [Oscillospiraceae bacterium]
MEKTAFETAHMAALNPQQRAAVAAVDGPVLLLAVPGSGKTTVLITRLGYMTEVCGIAPESILTMTYTVAATQEMRARFAARFGEAEAARMEFPHHQRRGGAHHRALQPDVRPHTARPAAERE